MSDFATRVVAWQRSMGRRNLPWQGTREPYRVWLSEIMLQQTQVATAVPYYQRFLAGFPDVLALARADPDEVMRLWAGLGYYARARNLHACAQQVVAEHGGAFPSSVTLLAQLPGIGRSTAAAILDGNVKRVLARCFGVAGFPGTAAVERELWARAEALLPTSTEMPAYTQGLMDLGATVCTRLSPRCSDCPLRSTCVAANSGRVDELPSARPKKATPRRSAQMLVALHGDAVLVEQRPGAGIWGGLLSLPQFERVEQLNLALRNLAPQTRAEPLPRRRHAFTHFTLEFTPYLARIDRPLTAAMAPRWRWLARGDVAVAALPTPIRALLRDLMRSPVPAAGDGIAHRA
jgi:A/G-specific adenine glycosylase